MALTLHTDTDRQFGLNWHGSAEGAVADHEHHRDPRGRRRHRDLRAGQQRLRPDGGLPARPGPTREASFLDYEYIQGEGDVDVHVDHVDDLDYDPVTGLLGPVDLPRNGMMRLWVSVDGVKQRLRALVLLRRQQRPEPWLNACEIAATPLP